MNSGQILFADSDSSLGHLLVQIDTFYQQLPEPVRSAFDKLGANVQFGCYCDLEPGQMPDACVIDTGRPQDCVNAAGRTSKHGCKHWLPINLTLLNGKQNAG